MLEHYQECKFRGILSDHIDCVWRETYTKQPSMLGRSHLVIPDNTVELVVTENTFERRINESGGKWNTITCHVSGLKTKPQEVVVGGSPLLSIRFKPYGLYRLTRVPLNETINQSICPSDIFGREVEHLIEKLFSSGSLTLQAQWIEDFFSDRLISIGTTKDLVFEQAIRQIFLTKGDIRVNEIAENLGVSVKTVERKFLTNLGVLPKKYCRIIRLFEALRIPAEGEAFDLMDRAYNHKFFDYMHFVKEVKTFTGLQPTEYFRVDRGIQQPIFAT
ncbi:MAG: helix-turn-helix domain-containing protein [Cyclobacteriaceae bacterium]